METSLDILKSVRSMNIKTINIDDSNWQDKIILIEFLPSEISKVTFLS